MNEHSSRHRGPTTTGRPSFGRRQEGGSPKSSVHRSNGAVGSVRFVCQGVFSLVEAIIRSDSTSGKAFACFSARNTSRTSKLFFEKAHHITHHTSHVSVSNNVRQQQRSVRGRVTEEVSGPHLEVVNLDQLTALDNDLKKKNTTLPLSLSLKRALRPGRAHERALSRQVSYLRLDQRGEGARHR